MGVEETERLLDESEWAIGSSSRRLAAPQEDDEPSYGAAAAPGELLSLVSVLEWRGAVCRERRHEGLEAGSHLLHVVHPGTSCWYYGHDKLIPPGGELITIQFGLTAPRNTVAVGGYHPPSLEMECVL